jgi:3-phenylpropionate/cinnamic acid dioxygenase small subunit
VKYGEEEREFTRSTTDINWFDEGKDTLSRRVKQIQTGIHWAEEPGINLIRSFAYSGPLEDLKLKRP